MIHRHSGSQARAGDVHAGKWNGLGGKAELDESPLDTARREFHEEAGLDLDASRFRALGTLTFPNFKAAKTEDWMVFVFTVPLEAEEVSRIGRGNDEGELHWIKDDEVPALNLWPGDRHFISHILSATPFIGTIWYDGSEVKKHWIQDLRF
jgi:8-oxo-dGTP diphosphatase